VFFFKKCILAKKIEEKHGGGGNGCCGRACLLSVSMISCDITLCVVRASVCWIAARNASWNPAGVEPIYWKTADIHPGSLDSSTNWKVRQFDDNGDRRRVQG